MYLDVVRAGGNLEAHVARIGRLAVILRETLADLGGSDPHDGVLGRVIVGGSAEDLDADVPLLHRTPAVFHDIAQEFLTLFTFAEGLAG